MWVEGVRETWILKLLWGTLGERTVDVAHEYQPEENAQEPTNGRGSVFMAVKFSNFKLGINEEGLAKFLESLGYEYVRNSHIKPESDLEIALSVKHFCDTMAEWSRNGTLKESAEMWKDV